MTRIQRRGKNRWRKHLLFFRLFKRNNNTVENSKGNIRNAFYFLFFFSSLFLSVCNIRTCTYRTKNYNNNKNMSLCLSLVTNRLPVHSLSCCYFFCSFFILYKFSDIGGVFARIQNNRALHQWRREKKTITTTEITVKDI